MNEVTQFSENIYTIRGVKVMLDSDLADIYGTEVKYLNRAVKRNHERFPVNFMFKLTQKEYENLKCQIGTSNSHGGRRTLPYVFTEHGAVMLASVLKSDAAISASIHVVNAFVQLRHVMDTNKQITKKLEELGAKVSFHDDAIAVLFEEIKKLAMPDEPDKKRKIGFKHAGKK
jgi:hypothetical protein